MAAPGKNKKGGPVWHKAAKCSTLPRAGMPSKGAKIIPMFDGINLSAHVKEPERWRQQIEAYNGATLCFYTPTDIESGEIRTQHYETHSTTTQYAKKGSYTATLKDTTYPDGSRKIHLTIKGSLHKNHYGGANWEPFPAALLLEEIQRLEETFCLPAGELEVHGLEFGVNLPVSFDVSDFIERQALLFGTHELTPYKPANGYSLGRYYEPKQGAERAIKLYNKGLQNALPFPLMRYELRYKKMRELKALGILNLSDLRNADVYPALLKKLLASWGKVLIGNHFTPEQLHTLPKRERNLLETGCFPGFWREVLRNEGSDAFTNKRTRYRQLLTRQGIVIGKEIRELIRQEWERLTGTGTAAPSSHFYGKSPVGETVYKARPYALKTPFYGNSPLR